MKEEIISLLTRVECLENVLTEVLGFVIPDNLTLEQSFELLTAIEDPLKSEIKRNLLTRCYSLETSDVRWIVLGEVIRFGVRFGGMAPVANQIALDVESALLGTAERVRVILSDAGELKATRYGYLRGIVAGLLCGLTEYDTRRLSLVTKENFINLDEAGCRRWMGMDNEFTTISSCIIDKAKEMCRYNENTYNSLPDIVRRLSYISSKDDLLEFKQGLIEKVRLIATFNELLDTF